MQTLGLNKRIIVYAIFSFSLALAGIANGFHQNEQFVKYVALHGSETDFDLVKTEQLFVKLKEAGFNGVRTDIAWKEIQPDPNRWDENRFEFYKKYVTLAQQYNLSVMIIFSNAPVWAISIYENKPEEFWLAYERYIQKVLSVEGNKNISYQLWNEANHFIDPIKPEDDYKLFKIAGSKVKESRSDALRYVNVLVNLPGWQGKMDNWVSNAGDAFDVIAIDHYPGTWTPFADDNWYPLDIVVRRINNPEDVWFGKQAAVIETGFSSWLWPIANQARQARWVASALPTIIDKIHENNDSNANKVVALGYYQLVDTCSNLLNRSTCHGDDLFFTIGIEAHFGLLESDYSEKASFSVVRSILATN